MKDGLPGVWADVGYETIATLIQTKIVSQFCGNGEQLGEQGSILQRQVSHGGDMTPRDEQNVLRRLWVDVYKRDNILILIHDFARYLALCYLTE